MTPQTGARSYVDHVGRPRFVKTRLAIDALVVVAALSAAIGTALRQRPPAPTGLDLWWQMIAVASIVLTLLWRERFPFASPAAIWIGGATLSFFDGWLVPSQPAVFVAGMGAALLLGSLRANTRALAGLAVVVGSALVVEQNKPGHPPSELLFTPLIFAVSWLAGYALRERSVQTEAAEQRAAQAERERETAARLAVAEERARIARELHDVVAHALSVMVLQVGVVRRRRPPAEAEDREALLNVEQAGRAALAEMRRLLDAMRRDGDQLELGPQPGLADLDALLDEVRATGLDVHLHVHGDRFDLSPVIDLSAYRIVQEALTNTLKHAHAREVDVELRYGDDDLVVEVTDDGLGGRSAPRANGFGHGLVGMRERVTIFGGEMSAGPRSNGTSGFLVRARLPAGEYGS
jgi:signal transduction histidine kinase